MTSLTMLCKATLVTLLLFSSGGCAGIKPYERGRLAHPTMLLGDLARPGAAHVHAIHEGAVGGSTGAEGGCGCN
jgi:hypothetical protein